MSDDLWETNADWWQDGFTDGADPEYEEQILPLARRAPRRRPPVLDIGCGEGQVAPARRGRTVRRRVVGIDPTAAPARCGPASAAADRSYVRSGPARCRSRRARSTPWSPASVFEHIRDVDAAIAEVGRVLAPGGRFLFFLNHPLLQTPNSGWIDDQILDPPEQYWRIGPYLVEDETIEEVEKDVFIPFIHRPLARYVNALAANGCYIEHMAEPAPPPGFLARAKEYADAATIPRLLFLCRKAA